MEIKLSQKLSQSLVMTPQLQQAIKLLQLSRLELIDEVRRELDANPVLADDDVDPRPRDNSDTSMPSNTGERPPEERFGETERVESERDLGVRGEEKKVREVDWEQFLENRAMQQPLPASRAGFDELPPIEQSLSRPTNLQDHLRWQLQMAEFTDEEKAFAELVISSLDENGFLDLKASYRDSITELEAAVEKEPSEKIPVFNIAVLHEKMGELDDATEYLQRFLGDDLTPEERAAAETAAKLVLRCQQGVDEVMKWLTSSEQQGTPREVLHKLRGKEVSLSDYQDGLAMLRQSLSDPPAPKSSSRSGHAHGHAQPAKSVSFFLDLERVMAELSELRSPPGPHLRKMVFDRAIRDIHAGKFSDALAAFARYLGKDLEPRERARVIESLSRLEPSRKEKSDESASAADLTIEHLAERAGLDPEDALDVLREIQMKMDPIGVASRDLRECLRVQAEVYGFDELEIAIIDRHLHNLEKHNFQAIARDLKVPLEEVYEAAKEIQKLESRPARNFSDTDDKTIAITPDVYVVRDADRWVVLDNDRGLQRLYINESLTKRLLKDPNAKEFLNEKLRSAHWLIRAIDQRRKTILRVTEAIVERQREFFERGVAFLKPMILRDIAEDVDLHESTISRVTTNKYVHTPQGLFELKYFFNSSIRRVAEEDIASESVKQAIKKIIEEEDKSNPLSDQAIVELLEKREGIQIARRTVAKYREMLGILASSKRKRLF